MKLCWWRRRRKKSMRIAEIGTEKIGEKEEEDEEVLVLFEMVSDVLFFGANGSYWQRRIMKKKKSTQISHQYWVTGLLPSSMLNDRLLPSSMCWMTGHCRLQCIELPVTSGFNVGWPVTAVFNVLIYRLLPSSMCWMTGNCRLKGVEWPLTVHCRLQYVLVSHDFKSLLGPFSSVFADSCRTL